MANEDSGARQLRRTVTIRRSATELYDVWRDLSRLPTFMRNVASVQENGTLSHWVASASDGGVEWDAEIIADVRPHSIAWRSIAGMPKHHHGEVTFMAAQQCVGTEMHVTLTYEPSGGAIGNAVARITGDDSEMQLNEAVMRFKMLMETGHIPTTDGQSHGGSARDTDHADRSVR